MGLTQVGEDAFTMHAQVTGLQELSDEQQKELGHLWLMAMYCMNIKVDGVKIEFNYDH